MTDNTPPRDTVVSDETVARAKAMRNRMMLHDAMFGVANEEGALHRDRCDVRIMIAFAEQEFAARMDQDAATIAGLREMLATIRPYLVSQVAAESLLDGFGPQRERKSDRDLAKLDAALSDPRS